MQIDKNSLDRSDFTRRRDINHVSQRQHFAKQLYSKPKTTMKSTQKPFTTHSPTTNFDSLASQYLKQWAKSWNTIDQTKRNPTITPKTTIATKLPNKSRTTQAAPPSGFNLFRKILHNFGWNF